MTDDIVTRLREEIDSVKVDVQVLREAADEIERLRAERDMLADALTAVDVQVLMDAANEIERLRAAGDALAEALHGWTNGMDAFTDDAERLRAWQEARRG